MFLPTQELDREDAGQDFAVAPLRSFVSLSLAMRLDPLECGQSVQGCVKTSLNMQPHIVLFMAGKV